MTEKPRRTGAMDASAGTFTHDGIAYDRNTIPAAVMPFLATLGLHSMIARAKDPAKLYTDLQAGGIKERAGKTLVYSTWHQAAAAAHAIGVVKAAGVRAKPGKKLYDTEEFEAAYKATLDSFSPWSRDKTKAAQERSAVVLEHERIVGQAEKSFDEIFGQKPAAEIAPDLSGEDL